MKEHKLKLEEVIDTNMTLAQIVDHTDKRRALLPVFCFRKGQGLPVALTGFVFEDSGEEGIRFPVLRKIA